MHPDDTVKLQLARRPLRGAFFHEFGHDHDHDDPFDLKRIHMPDHHGDFDGGVDEDEDEDTPLTWGFDNVELATVGVDIGSSTSHLLFARLHLARLTQSLSSRFVVVKREVLHRSPILLTPYRADGLIDIDRLEQFVDESYAHAGLHREDVDTGAVILTGTALERANARAVAELFASHGGKFVTASAGHNLEAILAAHGSGSALLSYKRGETLLHMDIGGGTSKLSVVSNGDIAEVAAVGVGGRLVAVDEQDRVTRIEHVAESIAAELGIRLALGEPLAAADRRRMADKLVEVLLEVAQGRPDTLSKLARSMLLTEPLRYAERGEQPAGVTFSGGVSEYIYGREQTRFGDIAFDVAAAVLRAAEERKLPAEVVSLGEGIRATVIGASQFTVQLSGNTAHITNPAALPLRSLPVVYARLAAGDPTEDEVAEAIKIGFRRLDLEEGEHAAAISLPWIGDPHYQALRALAGGIARAMPRAIKGSEPLVIALQSDIGRSLGGILSEELGVTADLISVDGLDLAELDYVDIGEVIHPANVVPVVIKSLAFPSGPSITAPPSPAPTPA